MDRWRWMTVIGNECASERVPRKGITTGHARRTRAPRSVDGDSRATARRRRRSDRAESPEHARGVVEAHARHRGDRLGAAQRLVAFHAEERADAELLQDRKSVV